MELFHHLEICLVCLILVHSYITNWLVANYDWQSHIFSIQLLKLSLDILLVMFTRAMGMETSLGI